MDINELDKKQFILVTLLITFVVSIGTGIVTVSLMKQMPQSVPQTINNVIQRTIEKVSTVESPNTSDKGNTSSGTKENLTILSDDNVLVSIYKKEVKKSSDEIATSEAGVTENEDKQAVGQGVIISDIGLILADSNIISENLSYQVLLGEETFDVSILKKFSNGFAILKIEPTNPKSADTDTSNSAQ